MQPPSLTRRSLLRHGTAAVTTLALTQAVLRVDTANARGPGHATGDPISHDLRDYGVVGDGAADDTDPICRAIRDAEGTGRDNVIFELGLFAGVQGQERTFLLAPRGTDLGLPTDLGGMTALDWDPRKSNLESALGAACTRLKATMRSLGLRSRPSPQEMPSLTTSPWQGSCSSQMKPGSLSRVPTLSGCPGGS